MNINPRISLHPKHRLHTAGQKALFLGEETHSFLPLNDHQNIDCVIQKKGRLMDFISQPDDIVDRVYRTAYLDTLIENDVLTDLDAPQKDDYFLPDFYKKIRETQINGKKIFLLCQESYDKHLCHWVADANFPPNLNIVFVDDLLDPRLLNINKTFIEKNANWLLLKVSGLQPSFGPWFTAQQGPCFECLRNRLVINNPVREWLRRQTQKKFHCPLPIIDNKSSLENSLQQFELILNNINASPSRGAGLYRVNTEHSESHFHSVTRRPQCSICGEADMINKIHSAPIRVEDSFPCSNTDGGYRQKPRDITLDNIAPLLSSETGLLTSIEEITHGDKKTLSIYQAAYFQNTHIEKSPDADTFVQRSLGKGIAQPQAQSSALGEALERQAAQYTGDEPVIFAQRSELDSVAFLPSDLAPFSEKQYQVFEKLGQANLMEPQVVKRLDEGQPLHWSPGWSLTEQKRVYFPTAFCLANTPFDDQHYSLYTHNGNAAGNTLEEAILQGALELIERDAAAIWWYNKIPRPEIDFNVIPVENREVIANSLKKDWEYWLLDISHDLSVVSCVAVGRHRVTQKFILGFGCHFDVSIAAQRALTEMYQLLCIKDRVSGPFDFNHIEVHPYLFPKKNAHKKTMQDYPSKNKSINLKHCILHIVEILHGEDLALCVVNYSRPDIPLKTLKVVVPGLCHFWPQYANRRLYETPVKLGWLRSGLQEDELNNQALYL